MSNEHAPHTPDEPSSVKRAREGERGIQSTKTSGWMDLTCPHCGLPIHLTLDATGWHFQSKSGRDDGGE